MQKQAAYVCMVFRKYHHMALVGLWLIKEELCKGFTIFQINSNHISNINYLDKHGFLRIFVNKHQDDKHGIKHMQANHKKHVGQVQHIDSL